MTMSDSADRVDDRLLSAVVAELKYGPLAPLDVERQVLETLALESGTIRIRHRHQSRLGRAAAMALLLAGAMVTAWIGGRRLIASGSAAPADPGRAVRFALSAPGLKRVAVVGDFNNWDSRATPLARQGGTWTVTLALQPGRYRYTFVVDGQRYLADPVRPPATDDDFGTPTSVITVVN